MRSRYAFVLSLALVQAAAVGQCFGPDGWTHNSALNMPTARSHIDAAMDLQGRIYVAGGNNGGSATAVYRFDETTQSWSAVAPLPTAMDAAAVTSDADGRIYVIGGFVGGMPSALAYRYDPSTDSWSALPSAPGARAYPKAVSNSDGTSIYFLGGYDETFIGQTSVFRFDVATSTWNAELPMLFPRVYFGVARTPSGEIYAVGGAGDNGSASSATSRTVERRDPATGQWTRLADLIDHPHQVGEAVSDAQGRVYVLGGWQGTSGPLTASVESYDPSSNTWSLCTPMPIATNNGAAILAQSGRLYFFGGDSHADTLYATVGGAPPPPPPQCDATALYRTYGTNPNDQHGTVGLVWIGDINHDTVADFAVGARRHDTGGLNDNGRVLVYSGANGAILASLFGVESCDLFGQVLTAADLDLDGVNDLIVSSPRNEECSPFGDGKITAYSGAALGSGVTQVIFDVRGAPGTDFGAEILPLELTGAAPPELVIASAREGKVQVYQVNGSTLTPLFAPMTAPVFLGYSLAGADVDGDSIPDIIASAIEPYVFIYSGANGSLLWSTSISDAGYLSVAGLGDLDDDGRDEFAVCNPLKNGYAGEVIVYSGATLQPIAPSIHGQPESQFGSDSVCTVGDVTGDGVPDFVAGQSFAKPLGQTTRAGEVLVFSGAPNSSGFTLLNIIDGGAMLGISSTDGTAAFGLNVVSGADVDGDGLHDLIVGCHTYQGALGAAVVVTHILGNCESPRPVAVAGLDVTVNEGAEVLLTGLGSSPSPNGSPITTYTWEQLAGPAVSQTASPLGTFAFIAPTVAAGGATLTFQLTVFDGSQTSLPDTVDVTVLNVNRPPVASAGDPQSVNEYAGVMLDCSSSFDPDDDEISVHWIQTHGPAATLDDETATQPMFVAPSVPVGGATLRFQVYVSDGELVDSDTVEVRVENINRPPKVKAGHHRVVDEGTHLIMDGSAHDPDGDLLTLSWVQVSGPPVTLADPSTLTPSFTAPLLSAGNVEIVLRLTADDGLEPASSDVTILVRDSHASPNCGFARPDQDVLWPANHKMVPVSIKGVQADGPGHGQNGQFQIEITSVTQDEPTSGLGNGDTAVDAIIQPDGVVLLRAERQDSGNGRVYVIQFTATDDIGQQCSGSVRVTVPRTNKKSDPAVDDGQNYLSTQ